MEVFGTMERNGGGAGDRTRVLGFQHISLYMRSVFLTAHPAP